MESLPVMTEETTVILPAAPIQMPPEDPFVLVLSAKNPIAPRIRRASVAIFHKISGFFKRNLEIPALFASL